MTLVHNIAEAGLELAAADDADGTCVRLRAWARDLTGARDVRVRYSSGTHEFSVGGDAAHPDGRWRHFVVEPGEREPHDWSAHLELLEPTAERWEEIADLLCRQAAIGFRLAQGRAVLARHERQQRSLVEAGKSLSSERTLDGVLLQIVERAMELTGAKYGALGVLDADREELVSFVTVGIDARQHARIGELPKGRGILGVLIDDPRPLRLSRLQDHPKSVGFPPHHPPMASFLGVPIVTTRDVAGRIYLTEKQGAPEFSLEDQELVETLASQAAIAIDNAALNEQLQETAAQLEEASRHKSSFLANMNHELRSPLNTIIGYTKLLLEDHAKLDEEQVEDLEIVRDSSEHLLALITDLLDLQRIEAGRVSLVLAQEDLADIIATVVASARPSVRPGVELLTDTSDLGDPFVRGDRTRLRQVLLNVLGNAIKFTEAGSITLTARDAGGDVCIEVRDTGPGIPPADQARIFDTFFQSDAALGRTPGPREGAGLGLAITRMLTELHGGSVQLRSAAEEGTTVTIQLPRSGPPAAGGVADA
jgi:signal transduction histidine kinase